MTATALALALAAALGWSLFDLLRKLLADRVAALPLVALITLWTTPPLLLWTAATGHWQLELAPYAAPGLASLLLNVIANLAFFRALQVSPLSVTLPLLSLTPVFTALLAAVFLGEVLGPRPIAGVALVVLGALSINLRPGEGVTPARLLAAFGREPGTRLMALVAFCWSLTLLLDKVALRHASPEVHVLVLNTGVAASVLLLLALRRQTAQLAVARGTWLLLAVSVLCAAATLTVQMAAIQRLAVALVETLKRGLGSLLAVVYGRALYREPLTPGKLGGVAAMVAGVALLLV